MAKKNLSPSRRAGLPRRSRTVGFKKLVVGALAAIAIGGSAMAVNLPYFKGEKVTYVVDGDTFVTENHQSIRLAGLDAPELTNCLGTESRNALSSLILNKRVHLTSLKTDPFRRIMALVYVNNTLVNEVMIRSGLAQYTEYAGDGKNKLVSANIEARTNKSGIFSPLCTQDKPPDPKCTIKGNVDTKVNKKFYYTPNCNNYVQVKIMKYQGDQWFCTETEAKKAGFEKAEVCK